MACDYKARGEIVLSQSSESGGFQPGLGRNVPRPDVPRDAFVPLRLWESKLYVLRTTTWSEPTEIKLSSIASNLRWHRRMMLSCGAEQAAVHQFTVLRWFLCNKQSWNPISVVHESNVKSKFKTIFKSNLQIVMYIYSFFQVPCFMFGLESGGKRKEIDLNHRIWDPHIAVD